MISVVGYKEQLYERLNASKELIPPRFWKSYNLITIDNFIFHIDDIKNERVKAKTCEEIAEYLEIVNAIASSEGYNQAVIKDLDKHIYSISDPFKTDVGFVVRPSYPLIFVLMMPWFWFLSTKLDLSKALIIAGVTFILVILYYAVKAKHKKTY